MTWRGTTTVRDRILTGLLYLLVLMYGLPFGSSVLGILPRTIQQAVNLLVLPVALPYSIIPSFNLGGIGISLADIVVFVTLLLVARNERIKHFIRFNAMQVLLLIISLLISELVIRILSNLGGGVALLLLILNNATFLAVLIAFGYGVTQSIRGYYADKIPKLSDAVYLQVQ